MGRWDELAKLGAPEVDVRWAIVDWDRDDPGDSDGG